MGKGHWTMADCVLDVLSAGVILKILFFVKYRARIYIYIYIYMYRGVRWRSD
jgi:hypothetical protein